MGEKGTREHGELGIPHSVSVILVIAFATLVRLYQLGTESLWIDEGYSLRDASEISSMTLVRPVYFFLLFLWMKLGHSEAWLRLPSVFFGVGSAALLYVAANRIYGHKVGLIAALLLAISPFHVNHAQEIRMYTLATFLVIAEVIFFIRYVDTGRSRDLAGSLVMAALAFLVFPPTVLMQAAFNLFFLGRLKQQRVISLRWYAGQFVIGLAALPLAPKLVHILKDYSGAWSWRLPRPGLLDLIWVIKDFNLWRIPEDHQRGIFIANVYAVCVLLLMVYGVVRIYKKARWQTSLVMLWLVVPLLSIVAISHAIANLWIDRYLIFISPAAYILTALGLVSMRRRWVFGLMAAVVILLPAVRLGKYYERVYRPEWREAVAYMENHIQNGDTIALYRAGNRYVFDYYYSGRAPWVALGEIGLDKSMFRNWSDRRIEKLMSEIPPGSKRIWFLLSYHEEAGGFSIENYINRRYHALEIKKFKRIKMYLVTPKQQVIQKAQKGNL